MIDLFSKDTICSLATAEGQAGIAIVRISGDNSESLLKQIFVPKTKDCPFTSHMMYYGNVVFNGNTIDECMAVLMRAPRSYTKENVVEIHLHGGYYTVKETIQALIALGARPSEPGEFTLRAFLNGRVDLSKAEAVMRIIHANGERAQKAAMRQLKGGASSFIKEAQQDLVSMLAEIEVAIDYPDEVEEQETMEALSKRADALAQRLLRAADERSARLLEEGLNVVLFGKPNAGKSTLLNALLQEERAIVTDIPGTTRDIVKGSILLDGLKINLFDTAGIREDAEAVEKIGVQKAKEAVELSDVAVLLVESVQNMEKEDAEMYAMIKDRNHILVFTKADLNNQICNEKGVLISAHTGQGMDTLKERILSFAKNNQEAPLTYHRHIQLSKKAAQALLNAKQAFLEGAPMEFFAVDLHQALDDLKEVTGERVDERILDDIFSRFCVGK